MKIRRASLLQVFVLFWATAVKVAARRCFFQRVCFIEEVKIKEKDRRKGG